MGEIGEVKMCRRIFNDETSQIGDIPFFKIGSFGREADAFISKELYSDYKTRFSFPKKGDILISAAGTIGRTVVYNGEDAYFQDSNIVWIDNDNINITNEFLYYILQIVKYNTEGGTIQRLYNNILKSTRFSSPSIQEQEKISSFLSLIDERIQTQNKIIEQLETLIKATSKKIFIQKIRFKDSNGNDYPHWESKYVGDILNIGSGRDYKHLEKGDIPVFGTGGLMTYVDSFLNDGETVCIGRKGTIDKPMYYDGKIWTVDTLFYTHSFQDCIPKFIFYLFQTINWLEYNEASGVPSLSKTTIEKIKVQTPSLEEQKVVSQFLNTIDGKIQIEKATLEQLEMQKKYLLQQMFV
ncbi:Type I restriction-modification system specificty subunit [Flavobacterium beibuense]|uniref:Type I restriction-modification system specificty subunit n=1 Tax=Flavobacterium beibuense TaxID=657326 RepID=A0A444WHU4_9FLAO|nr:Type I restriction-modification system specificty subunit [Flavobacterium beibuense]